MSSYPIYVLIENDDYWQAVEDGELISGLGPSKLSLLEEEDFHAHFGGGYVSSTKFHNTEENRAEAAMEIARFFGDEICHVDGSILMFKPDAPIKLAEKQLARVRKLLDGMTAEKYLKDGGYLLRTAMRADTIFVHTYGYGVEPDDCFVQSADRFITETLQHWEARRFVVTQTVFCHG